MKHYYVDGKEISKAEAKAIQEEQMKWVEEGDLKKLINAKFILIVEDGVQEQIYYCVSMTIKGNSHEAHISKVLAKSKPENTFHSTDRADYYKDYFDSYEEAEAFINS